MRFSKKALTAFFLIFIFISLDATANTYLQGIYLHEETMRNAKRLQYLIDKSKEVGINTFVIDLKYGSKAYQNNIKLVLASGIKYVARIVIFPDGATPAQVANEKFWQSKYRLVQKAINLGASEIQLDYIRYDTSQRASIKNARNISQIIRWFKNKLAAQNIPLQVDVFGVTSFGDSLHIGQSLPMFAEYVDAVCPMVYPSHYEPYLKYARMPYFAVRSSLKALHEQFPGALPFKVYPFIELYNYRYPLSQANKLKYISEELAAVEDSQTDGWYAWNIHNNYNNLFIVLKSKLRGKA